MTNNFSDVKLLLTDTCLWFKPNRSTCVSEMESIFVQSLFICLYLIGIIMFSLLFSLLV